MAANAPHRNRLAAETSPYLLQHAGNPVDWYPWGEDALERARREDRPILLSIGYSACHWCHVMAHESFEDPDTAALMNRLYVNVKVDREERPDLDRLHQLAHQVLTRRGGGWPLTMFLAPDDRVPFFGGTYFPREARHGLPSFRAVLERVAEYFAGNRDAVRGQNAELLRVLDALEPAGASAASLSRAPLEGARATLEQAFDADWGGFGGAPKFPHAGSVERLLRHWAGTARSDAPDLRALYMATLTLTRMAEGGLFDHVGGGFARYSVDAEWRIPHFEKMLYDNGQLLALYASAALATGEDLYRATANATADFLLRDLGAPGGGLCSSLDADSEGREGRYYAWDRAEVERLLDPDEYRLLARRYGLDGPANFDGRHHLHAHVDLGVLAAELGVEPGAVRARLAGGLEKLRAARGRRAPPGRDDKVLTAWNALAIRGLAVAARAFARPALADAATAAVDFLRRELWRDGRLHATWQGGRARFGGYLDDHAFLLDALLEVLQVRWRGADLAFAVDLAEALLARFEDRGRGGFWFTADDAEPLLRRSKTFADESLPSGNGVAARALGRLGHLLGEPRYLAAAERTLRAAWPVLEEYPHAHASLLDALEETLAPPEIVIVRGAEPELGRWREELARLYAPRRLVLAIPAGAADVPPALAVRRPGDGTIAYVCEGATCGPPLGSLPGLVGRLRDGVVLAGT